MKKRHGGVSRSNIILISLLMLLSFSASARADEGEAETKRCDERGAPWIRLRVDDLAPELRAALLVQVRSSLAARNIELCVSDENAASKPLATLHVTTTNTGVASIAVEDGVTKKRVQRDIDLTNIPADGHPVTIALALDELLRASWAELLLADAPAPALAQTPKVVADAININTQRTTLSPEVAPRTWELGAAFAAEHFAAGQNELGVDIVGRYFPWAAARIGFVASVGFRSAFAEQAPRGEIRSTALTFVGGLDVPLLGRTEGVELDLLAEALLARVTFVAEPSSTTIGNATSSVRGNEKTVLAGYVVANTRVSLALYRSLRAFAKVGGGVPLHTAYAVDGDVRVTGLGGLLLMGHGGLSWVF